MTYQSALEHVRSVKAKLGNYWDAIRPEDAARMVVQNRFKTGLDIAKYTASIMRRDMAEYDADNSKYTQSLGCWHGFIAQQKMIANKKYFGTTSKRYIYLSGWMVAALRSEFGPLPDQSMHEKTAVPKLIEEIYTFLRQADAKELNDLFRALQQAEQAGDEAKVKEIEAKIDNFETHVVPIIADIDAGFGNEEATYLLTKQMIEAGACAIQIENQVSDAKQCGHQAGKVTVPHEDFLAKINAVRYAFLELGVDEGVIVARTDSEGADLTQKIPVSREAGDLASKYISYLQTTEIDISEAKEDEILIKRNGKLHRPTRLPSGLYQFREGTQHERVVLDCVTSLQNGADMIWIETPTPDVAGIARFVNDIKNKYQMPNWCTTIHHRLTGQSTSANKPMTAGRMKVVIYQAMTVISSWMPNMMTVSLLMMLMKKSVLSKQMLPVKLAYFTISSHYPLITLPLYLPMSLPKATLAMRACLPMSLVCSVKRFVMVSLA